MIMRCPNCDSQRTGLLNPYASLRRRIWFCQDCCVEFQERAGVWQVFNIDPNGELVLIAQVAVGHEERKDLFDSKEATA